MLRIEGISKSFGEVEVLRNISLSVESGEILGLIGENGAGKSTLMNILGGIFKPSAGSMHMDEKIYDPDTVLDAEERGFAFIHQELNLFPNLTIAENLFINKFPLVKVMGRRFLNKARMLHRSRELLARVGLQLHPNTSVGDLSQAQRQLLEIAKALSGKVRLIIFDEPTTALSHHETQALFTLMNELRKQDISMIYISHDLQHVKRMSDRIAILRDGVLISEGKGDSYSMERMIKDMVGRDLDTFFPVRSQEPTSDVMMEVKDLSSVDVESIAFEVNKGEILGFYGLVGAGRSEMVKVLFGLDKKKRGLVKWKGKTFTLFKPARWIRAGVGFLTEDRHEEGLLLTKGVLENIQLSILPDYAGRLGIVDRPAVKERALAMSTATKIKFHHFTDQAVDTLSGGNQQKVVLAKWLITDPDLLILDEPTKGIDIGAKHEIYTLINSMVDQGRSVIMISSEIEELLALSDRIIVMNQGRVTAQFDRSQFDKNVILENALKPVSREKDQS